MPTRALTDDGTFTERFKTDIPVHRSAIVDYEIFNIEVAAGITYAKVSTRRY